MKKINSFSKDYFFVLITIVFFTNIILAQTTTWDGLVWSNGLPDSTKDAIFTGNYISPSNIATKSVSVLNSAQVTIASPHTLTVTDNITIVNGSKLVFENNASLFQTNASATNSGNINFKRNANPMVLYDYTYWSSPVANQSLFNFSPLTSPDRYFSFNATTNNWVNENSANGMQLGKGFAIMAPQTYNSTLQIFNGEFIGVPNNGDVTSEVVAFDIGLLNFNLLGNPYPSAISIPSLIDNSTLGTLYFWTHHTPITNNVFSTNDYAIRTRNVGIQAFFGGPFPGDYIAAGQGFFASSSATGTITFTNQMKVIDNNSQFYKNTQSPEIELQFYYLWLNMTNEAGAFKQIALGYEEGATDGYDFGTDALAVVGNEISFYSLIGDDAFVIQGRAYPWDLNDQIPLGYSTTINGTFDITLDHNDPFFDSQTIFIEDTLLEVFHNLKTGPYSFNTEIGIFNTRFKILYFDPSLSYEENLNVENLVIVSSKNKSIVVNSTLENINTIQIFDLLGKMIFEKNNINEKQCAISNLGAVNQTLIIKIQLETNQTIVKKLVY
ncbi:MAG: T9SS sorting signal type C domain-containing protein [Flavobacterium sp.]